MPWEWVLVYLILGALVGVLAGMLGVGGGLVIVPVLLWSFHAYGIDTGDLMQLAVGTSLASIIFTSLSSIRAQHLRGAIDWWVVAGLSPGVVIGVAVCSYWVGHVSSTWLQWFFALFELLVALQMALALKAPGRRQLPNWPAMSLAGMIIGAISSLVGIGGGTMTVPYLTWHRVAMKNAVAISTTVGLPIAIAGTLGYMLAGWDKVDLPEASWGYIYWPALMAIVPASMLFAPLGVYLSHSLPTATLKRVFAGLLAIIAIRMMWF